MIHYTKGNILESEAEALVNPVNTVGVMGKGLALQFKKAYPYNFERYKEACSENGIEYYGKLEIGKVYATGATPEENNGKIIINFPTKKHWKDPSRYEYIDKGLDSLRHFLDFYYPESVAIPPLGCGLGGLEWNKVKQMIEEKLGSLTETEVYVYEP